jgi:hypothetical protein
MTVTNLAAMDYNSYTFANSDAGKTASSQSSVTSQSLYGVSNLQNALSSFGNTESVYGISTVDAYAQNSYTYSQSPAYSSSSGSVDTGTISGTVDNYALSTYNEQKLGLSSSDVNLNGILNVQSAATESYMASTLPSSDSLTGDYESYISSSPYSTGSLIDTPA